MTELSPFAEVGALDHPAGGTHDDWDTYDRTMAQERRAAIFLTPRRSYANPDA